MERKQVLVTCVSNPFDPLRSRSWKWLDWESDWNPKNYAAAGFFPLASKDFDIAVSCNGALIPEDKVDFFIPSPGDNIVFCHVLHGGGGGGGGGKDTGRTIAMIAVMAAVVAVTYGAGSALVASGAGWATTTTWTIGVGASVGLSTAGAIAASAAGMAVGIAGAMLVNAVLPAATANVSGLGYESIGGFESSPTYSWSVESNSTDNGAPLPVLFGTRRITPPLVGRYVSLDDDQQFLNLLYTLCGGVIDSITDVWINENSSDNFDDIALEKRYGASNQSIISYFNDTISEQAVGYLLETGDWDTFSIFGDSVEGIGVGLSLPNGLYYVDSNGSLLDMVVEIDVEYRKDEGAWQTFTGSPFTIQAKEKKTLRRFYTMRNLTAGTYDVRAKLHAAAHRPGQVGNPSGSTSRWSASPYLEYVQGMIMDDFRYPGVAMLGIRALATDQLSGSRPRVTCLASRNTVPVWTGSEYEDKDAFNPAWACYDILHNGASGHPDNSAYGGGVPYSRIVYDDFSDWADYCDTKGLECHIYFDSAMTLSSALARVSEMGRGQVIQRGTYFSCIVDKASTPVQLFTVGNIGSDSFKESFLEMKDRANVIEVSYFDADRDYTRQPIEYRALDYDEDTTEERRTAITLYGCVSKQLAINHAKFLLNCNTYLTRTISFEASVEAIAIQPGDVFRFQHDVPQWGYGGRVVAATGTSVQLDQEVTLEEGTTYKVGIRHKDDTFEIQTVTNSPGTTDTLTVASWTSTPEKFEPYCFGPENYEYKLFRTISVSRGSEQDCTITALEYHSEIYDDEGDLPTEDEPSLLDPVRGLSVREIWSLDNDGTVITKADLSWRGEAVSWSVYYRVSGENWILSASGLTVPSYQIENLVVGTTYDFSVTITGPDGGEQDTVTLVGKGDPPSDVESFSAQQNGATVTFIWTKAVDVDLKGYELRYMSQSKTFVFEDAVFLTRETKGTLVTNTALPPGSWTIGIKAVDRSGNYSETAKTYDLTVTQSEYDLVIEAQQDPSWLETKSNFIRHDVSGGRLVPQSQNLASDDGWDTFDLPVPNPYETCIYEISEIDAGYDVEGLRVWAELSAGLMPGASGAADPIFSIDYKTEAGAYDGFESWTIGHINARYVKSRATVLTGDGIAYLEEFKLTVDLPERSEQGQDVTIGIGGTAITFDQRFYLKPNVYLTADGVAALYPVKDTVTVNGFNCTVYDSTGTDVGGTIDWRATGN